MGHSATSIQLQTEESLMTQSPNDVKTLSSLPFSVLFCARESISEVSTQCDLPTPSITTNVATQCCLDLDFSLTPFSTDSPEWELQQCTGTQCMNVQDQKSPFHNKSIIIDIEAVQTHLAGKPELSSPKGIITDTRSNYIHDPINRMECYENKKHHQKIPHKGAPNLATKCLADLTPNTKKEVTNLSATQPSSVTAVQRNNCQSKNVPHHSFSGSPEVLALEQTSLAVETSSLHIKLNKHCVLPLDTSTNKQKSPSSPKKVCMRFENEASVHSVSIPKSKLRNGKKVYVQANVTSTNEKKNWYLKERFVQKDGKILYKCFRCEEEFERKFDLTTHKQNEHKSKAAGMGYSCSECGNKFKSASKYHSHMGSHDDRFRCQICSKVFMRVVLLKKHLRVFHAKSSAVICLVCGTCFENQSDLDAHIDQKHSSESGPLRAYSKECKHCLKEYVSENSFLKHVEFAPYKCEICLMTFSCNAKLKAHEYLKHKPQVCEYCGKSFDAFDNYRRHVKEFHSEKGVSCPYCVKKFSVRSRMLVHVDVKHTPGLKYKCSECDYRAKNYASVSRHLRIKHRPRDLTHTHICPVCSKAFLVLSKLKVHLHTHAESKPFRCDFCGKGYTSKYRLTKHQKQNHQQRAIESFCHLCNLDLGSSEQFIEHMESFHNLNVTKHALNGQPSPVVDYPTSHQSIFAQGQDAHPNTLYHSNSDSHSSLLLPSYPTSVGVVRLPPSECISSGDANVVNMHHQVSPLELHRSDGSESGGDVSACILAKDAHNVISMMPSSSVAEPSGHENETEPPLAPVRNIIQCAYNNRGRPLTAPASMPTYVFINNRL